MKLATYQDKAYSFALYRSNLYPYLALAEEAGEVCGKVAKMLRKQGGFHNLSQEEYQKLREQLSLELGDVLWNVAACATELDLNLETIAKQNLAKLTARKEKGTLQGSGDNR